MSLPLFNSNIKNNRMIWIIMLVVYSFYFSIMISMYDPEGLKALLNLYAIVHYFTLGGIGFFASAIVHEAKHSLAIGIGLPIAFLVLEMLGNSDPDLSWIGNLSLFALFDPQKLIDGNTGLVALSMAGLFVLAALLYGLCISWFNRRDLHI